METEKNGMDAKDEDGGQRDEILRRLRVENIEAGLIEGDPPEPVDKSRLVAYLRNELTPRESGVVDHLVSIYRKWYDAYWSVLSNSDEIGLDENAGKD